MLRPPTAAAIGPGFDVDTVYESVLAIEGSGHWQKAEIRLTSDVAIDIAKGWRLASLVRLSGDPVGKIKSSNDYAELWRTRGSMPVASSARVGLEIRELYLDGVIGGTFIRVGRQQVVWGQADGLRVLDVINPLDLSEFILLSPEERRIPLWMVNIEWRLFNGDLQLIWIPDHTYDHLARPGSPFEATSPLVRPEGQPPPADQAVPDVVRPHGLIADDDYGIRWKSFRNGWDLSVNYLFHYTDRPYISVNRATNAASLRYKRTHLIGASLARAIGKLTFRTEMGYSTDQYFLTQSGTSAGLVDRATEHSYVVGIDYQHNSDLLLSGQLFQSFLSTGKSFVRDMTETQLTFLAQKKMRNDALTLRTLVIHGANRGDGVIQTAFEYSFKSNVVLSLGFDWFYGSVEGIFGQFDHADRLLLGIQYGLH